MRAASVPSRGRLALAAALLGGLFAALTPVDATGTGKAGRPVLRMGYSTALLLDVSRPDAEAALSLSSQAYAREDGFFEAARNTVYDDVEEMAADVRAGALDFVTLSSLDYLRIRGDTPLEPALVSVKGGNTVDRQLLMVHREGGVQTVGQLGGQSVALLAGGEGLATMWLDTVLARRGLPPAAQFLTIPRQGTRASNALLSVFFRKASACVVNANALATAAELNPQLGRDLVALEQSPAFPLSVMCLRADLAPALKERIVATSLEFLTTPAGRQVLTMFRIEGVAHYQPGSLDGLEALLAEHDALGRMARGPR